ncbi:MAG: PSD1 domain-containing protein, partial [Pirellulaceae bacterium]|nr:PSD1 domain-containing protein [Pirellulaceae bacterium]
MPPHRILLIILCLLPPSLVSGAEEPALPSFSRDILPILAENCFACHGPDVSKRLTDLRLDSREELLKSIKPDDLAGSEFFKRIKTTDSDLQMPPPTAHKRPLNSTQIQLLERWVKGGAVWEKHWSFEPPVKVKLPENGQTHPIDAFIVDRLTREGLTLSPSAALATLQRRVSFDLNGLPPAGSDRPLDGTEATYSAYVDDLLRSPHFGERMAMWWLDVARYSDTDGFQSDATRTNWPWRDWVVEAFNKNMPYGQFTIEQFAGDLLPDATDQQKLATCFHRNHMTNGEGGRDAEESRVDYVIDRVNTFGTVWLGMTLGWCQCHSHKFDPISQKEYYSLSAFFNSIDEDGKAGSGAKPYLKFQSTLTEKSLADAQSLVAQRQPLVEAARVAARTPFEVWLAKQFEATRQGFQAWQVLQMTELHSTEGTQLSQESDLAIQASGPHPHQDDYRVYARPSLRRITGLRLEILPHASHTAGALARGKTGEFILTDIKLQVRQRGSSQLRDVLLSSAIADNSVEVKKGNYGNIKDTLDDDPRNGWTTKGAPNTEPHVAVYGLAEALKLADDEEITVELRQRSTDGDANIGRFRLSVTDQLGETLTSLEPSPLEELSKAPDTSNEKLKQRLFEQFLLDYEPFQLAKQAVARAEQQLAEMKKAAAPLDVMVLAQRTESRETFVLERGVWDKHGDKVDADVPLAIAQWPVEEPRNRLGLARWIVSRQNPLTARVMVNHMWQLLFGQGLVRTQEDFGVQGDAPLYPELLDWLAVDFMEHDWDIKRLLKLIVTSRTYQQSSAVSVELLARDPDNRLLARGARFRLPSWMLRDAALRVSGLMTEYIGGPPVRPYQPDGVWEELFMGRFKYEPSEGAAQYRRTLYAFWRRSIAPTFLFDSAQRRSCEVRVGRTNTPLQALTLLNDATYLEAACNLAQQATTHDQRIDQCIAFIMQRVVGRNPSPAE